MKPFHFISADSVEHAQGVQSASGARMCFDQPFERRDGDRVASLDQHSVYDVAQCAV